MSVIRLENVSFHYRKDEPLIKNLSFYVDEGELFAVLGPNGSGKTTLLKLILGFLRPTLGHIMLFGKNLRVFKEWDRIGYVPQYLSVDKFFTGSVQEIFRAFAKGEKIGWAITYLHLEGLLNRPFIKLSGGERQKVLLALALSTNPDVLILDEPTTGLDIHAQEHIETILKDFKGKKTIVIVSHDIGFVLRIADRVLCMGMETCQVTSTENFKGIIKEIYGLH